LLAGFGINRWQPRYEIKKENSHKQSKQKKRCLKKGCNNYVAKHFHRYCDDCFILRSEKSAPDDAFGTKGIIRPWLR
jgi:coproporphyrinogen III oxidase